MNEQEAEVWGVIEALNQAWVVDGDAERLREYFHPEMVAITASDAARLDGVEACVASWRGFVAMAQIRRWQVREPRVRLFAGGTCAVVAYYYELSAQIGARQADLRGRDLFTLVRENGRWWVVSDHFSAYPAGDA